MCRLIKARPGHPESGTWWEKHLTQSIVKFGGQPIHEHPTSFWCLAEKFMLTVYVNDLIMSGLAAHHEAVCKKLADPKIGTIKINDPEDLDSA